MNFTIKKNLLFRGQEQYLDHAAPVEGSSPLPGASPISKSVQKVVWTNRKYIIFVRSRCLLGCDRLLPFLIQKNTQNPPPRTHPGRSLFTFLGGENAHGLVKYWHFRSGALRDVALDACGQVRFRALSQGSCFFRKTLRWFWGKSSAYFNDSIFEAFPEIDVFDTNNAFRETLFWAFWGGENAPGLR